MKVCPLFQTGANTSIETKVKDFLNEHPDYLSKESSDSTRSTGDAIHKVLSGEFENILGGLSTNFRSDFSAKAMEDFAFKDQHGYYVAVDVKTHRISKDFSMPNLVSVEKLAKFYMDDNNVLAILMVSYKITGTSVVVDIVRFVPIENLAWDCLTLGALGWGQIQIKKSSNILIEKNQTRKQWMMELCDRLLIFYPKEQQKITERITRFEQVNDFWTNHSD